MRQEIEGKVADLGTSIVSVLATGAKGKTLFMPLRLALTGQPRGPEMAVLLPLIDRAKIIARLNGQTA